MNTKTNNKMSAGEIFLRFFFGFLLPYLAINGLILFLFIQTPTINVLDIESKDYENDKIKFTISCLLPLIDVKTYFQETEIPYSKFGNQYIIDIKDNGSYQIKVTALNKSFANSIIDIETKDFTAPILDVNSAVVTGNTLIFSVYDTQSGINYDNLYATLEDGTKLNPSYVDKSSGTVQFQIENGKKVVIHLEDDQGNGSDTSFNID